MIPELVLDQDRNVRLSTLSTTYTRDIRDNTLDAHKGVNQSIQVDYNTPRLGSNIDSARLQIQQAYFKPVFSNMI